MNHRPYVRRIMLVLVTCAGVGLAVQAADDDVNSEKVGGDESPAASADASAPSEVTQVSAAKDLVNGVVRFTGLVHIDRPNVKSLLPTNDDMRVLWVCQEGQVVRKGDVVVIYDTSVRQERVAQREMDLAIARTQLSYDNLRLQNELDELLEEQAQLEADLAVTQATLVNARKIDQDKVALAEAEYHRSAQQAEDQQRELVNKRVLFQVGELSADDLVKVEVATKKAKSQSEMQRIRWQRMAGLIDEVEVERLELEERKLKIALGIDEVAGQIQADDGDKSRPTTPGNDAEEQDQPVSGIAKRIAALRSQIERERKKNEVALERAENELREAVRDAFNHLPLTHIEITPTGEETPIRRIAFGPADDDVELPDGYVPDAGLPFDALLGFGWDRDMTERLRRRPDVADALQKGVMLVHREAVWRCRLEDGEYELRIGVGDKHDWHGPVLRVGDRAVVAKEKIEAPEVIEETVVVEGGELVLRCGHDEDKVLRSPGDGVIKPQPWMRKGQWIWWNDWPVAFYTDPADYMIQGLVHQDVIALLTESPPPEDETEAAAENVEPAEQSQPADDAAGDRGEAKEPAGDDSTDENVQASADPADEDGPSSDEEKKKTDAALQRINAAREQVATSAIDIRSSNGARLDGQVSVIDNTPVKITRGPAVWYRGPEQTGKDLIARHVLIKPDEAQAHQLKLGESVVCRAWIERTPEMRVLPAHFVVEGEQHNKVLLAAGEEKPIEGFRVGAFFYVIAGVDDDTKLIEPVGVEPDQRDQRRKFAGQVVPGKKTEVGISTWWGRIKTMVDDGVYVKEDELIITLYNPELDANRQKLAEDKVKAKQEYLVAVETRRVKSAEAQAKHREKVLEEREARLKLRELQQQDPIELARAQTDRVQARVEAETHADRYVKYQSLGAYGAGELVKARIAMQRTGLLEQKAYLLQIDAERGSDWVKIQDHQQRWLAAVDALSHRELALHILRKEEHVSAMAAQLKLERAMEGNWQEKRFEQIKDIRAPVSGRIFYNTGWDDHTRARTKIKKDFVVWGGLPIAQILDMSELGMEVELPEDLYGQVNMDVTVYVGFDQYPGVEVQGQMTEIGKSFFTPTDLSDQDYGEQPANLRKVFSATVRFKPPAELADQFVPGTKGYVYLP